jgi:hypothetical protein
MTQEATISSDRAATPRRSPQHDLNHRAVSAADAAHLRTPLHPGSWERRGLLGILRRRSRRSSVR